MMTNEGANVGDSGVPTQAELYEDLKRIGELEDQKRTIQDEIDQRTNRLKTAIPNLEKDSLLYQMLSKSFGSASGGNSRAPTKKSTKAAKSTKPGRKKTPIQK